MVPNLIIYFGLKKKSYPTSSYVIFESNSAALLDIFNTLSLVWFLLHPFIMFLICDGSAYVVLPILFSNQIATAVLRHDGISLITCIVIT